MKMAEKEPMFYQIRHLHPDETPLLETFLYEAIFIPNGVTPPPRTIINQPSLRGYINDFGSGTCDHALVAMLPDGIAVGAVWVRLLPEEHSLLNNVPTLAISVLSAYRAQGIGTALLRAMLVQLASHGCQRVALSVQKANSALHLYQRIGFTIVKENGEEIVMVCEVGSACQNIAQG